LPTTPVVPVTPLTDTEALDLVQKMHLNIFGSMPIPFQSWLENAILLIILVLNQYLYGGSGFGLMTIKWKEGLYQEQRQ
jgi:hypothetical protein